MRQFAAGDVPRNVRHIWASTETKAIEAAGILAGALGLGIDVDAELGENDRRVAGFLPPAEFEQVADSFFAHPDKSIRGWERATDAQARIVGAVTAIAARHRIGDLAIVGHGAVGTLLHAAYSGRPISRDGDQPFQGHYWTASLPDLVPRHCWRAIAPR
ncbi:histidine phosphatase family protein [Sphingomonas floccifaciens]|uniref:Histidine phosphatase family protein n=1 Tax=Sphingomonas floccifaciens TaxID=1844115 RepID=A0ABW4NIZ9_9SPHN